MLLQLCFRCKELQASSLLVGLGVVLLFCLLLHISADNLLYHICYKTIKDLLNALPSTYVVPSSMLQWQVQKMHFLSH